MISEQCASLTRMLLVGILWTANVQGLPSPSTSGSNAASGTAYKFEEYMVEHEVSSLHAKNAALVIDPETLSTPFGCQKCSTQELRYCESASFVSDHCCCDRRFHVIYPSGLNRYPDQVGSPNGIGGNPFLDPNRKRCPLCDSSVYSYCSDKLFHDSCCCYRPINPYDRLPYECQYADCNFLHANTCKEHELISACCCTNLYLKKK